MNKKTIITALLAVLTLTAFSQCTSTTAESTPGWLWEISGNGLQQKSYLFGTCHGGGHSFTYEDVFGFRGVDDALSNVKTVYFETNLTVGKRLAAKEMSIAEWLGCPNDATKDDLMPEGVTYESFFDSVAQYQEVHQFLTQKMGDAEYWKKTPLYWFNHLVGYNFAKGYYGIQSVEGVLSTEAAKRGIEISQLEDVEQHAQWFGRPRTQRQRPNIPLKTQAWMLYIGIHNDDDQAPEPVRQLAAAYLKDDTCSVHDWLESHAEYNIPIPNGSLPTLAMNQAWCPVIEQNIAKGACMVAVGARHLLGNDGLIAMLRKKGYTVEPVK
ncbi:MAG: TraB/GumN family protein [Bacteroidaceae bacterium]|nr:TraB/GumN family protein [Bacteroidaceae bacterium]